MTTAAPTSYETGTTPPGSDRGRVGVLVGSNLLAGVGVASGIAVGALLVEDLGATSLAGLGQGLSVLGAAVAAVPLAGLAARRGRRWSLTVGYAVALLGAVLVVSAAVTRLLPVLFVGLLCFGFAQATSLQSRYAAVDGVPPDARGRTMSLVIWSATVGSVAGPNLTALGQRVGEAVGVPGLGGPYLFSVVAFLAAALLVSVAYRARPDAPTQPETPVAASAVATAPTRRVGALEALRWAVERPRARLAVVLVAGAHAVMVMVMVMTPLHMRDDGMSLQVVGVVISLHIAGMYALSPVFGTLVDRWGETRVAALGLGLLTAAVCLGFLSAATGGSRASTAAALLLLGLGWSACTISGAALVSASATDEVRVPLQGATDALMSYAGAGAAALAGPILALGDFRAVNVAGALILVPVALLLRSTTGAQQVS